MPAKRVKRWCGRERNGRRKPESVPPGSTISPLAIWGGGKGGGKKQNEWKRGSAVISTKAAGQGKASCLAPLAGWALLWMPGVCRIRRRCALFLNGEKPLDLVVDRSINWAVVLFSLFSVSLLSCRCLSGYPRRAWSGPDVCRQLLPRTVGHLCSRHDSRL